MYGWLLESVQHFIVQECGEEIWETILREAGARNTVFSATQQYPDALMLRLASALARLVSKDPNSPTTSTPGSPSSRKQSFKSKPWRSSSVHSDSQRPGFKCPFSATNALTQATKKEIDAYNSKEEIAGANLSAERINEGVELEIAKTKGKRRSLGLKLEDRKTDANSATPLTSPEPDSLGSSSRDSDTPTSPLSNSDSPKKPLKPILRKNSCTVALDVYKRRGSGVVARPRFNSISLVSGEKLSLLKEKFGTPEKVMDFFGRCFVKFFSNYGYDTMIRATGRYFCTFLQSVDSIHQRMRFTFPRMRSPSMQLTRAHRHGAELVYSSGRTGYTHYLMGQLYEIAEDIFSLKLKASVVKEYMEGSYYVAVLRLEFDNSDYVQSLMLRKSLPCLLPAVPASLLLQLFPFGVLLDRRMKILNAGDKLVEAWGGPYNRIEKSPISEILRLRKPKVTFTWDKVVCMQTMLFELELMRWRARTVENARRGSQGARAILLKGPIYLLEEIDALIFLCSPIFNDLDELRQAGLYLADLNGHGLSKEMLLQGWQHLSRLELLFEKAESRSLSLEKSCRLLDQWKKRGDQLLYSMIPKAIADHLRAGKDPMAACQAFDGVTIIFCGVELAEAGSRQDVMQTVAYMNDVYSRIDRLLDAHRVYKVETVGTVYMLVSGAPERRRAHAAVAASAALALARALPALTIGVHSGPCVAGVLGLRLPRYCLVGDTVNTASRMQTSSEAFDGVTIIFCGVELAEAGSRQDVMQTVAYMNDVYSRIDRLLDAHRVYKVETVGTVYMLVSGAPERRRAHAAVAASAALALARALPALTIGVHSGPCVAGVLGLRLPRYCLVGDTVNTASRMQTSSEPGKIQISAQTAAELPAGKFRLRSRGLIKVKGKGMMETFWLEGEIEEDDQDEALQLFSALCGDID